jgi:NAD+ kinase
VSRARVRVVLKRSAWHRWVEEENDGRVTELIEAQDESVRRMRASHVDHSETIEEVRSALADLGAEATWHDQPHDFRIEGPCDLVITVGGDGTLLSASHGIGPGVPLLGVNSAPEHSVGFFCGAVKGNAGEAIASALAGRLRSQELARMQVGLNGGCLSDRVLNEALFCHASPAATSRYIVRLLGGPDAGGFGGAELLPNEGVRGLGGVKPPPNENVVSEEHKSSGIWVGPAAGSTAAQQSAGGSVLPLSSQDLQYVVREPYRPHGETFRLTLGLVTPDQTLLIKSKMRHARVFLDGDHLAYEVTIGDAVTMRRSDEPLVVLGLARNGESRRGTVPPPATLPSA